MSFYHSLSCLKTLKIIWVFQMTRSGSRNDDLVPWLSMVHFFLGFPCPTFLTLQPVCRPSQCSPQIMFNSPPAPLRLTSPYVIPLSALCFRLALIKPTPHHTTARSEIDSGLTSSPAWDRLLFLLQLQLSFTLLWKTEQGRKDWGPRELKILEIISSSVKCFVPEKKSANTPINFRLATFNNNHKSKTKKTNPQLKKQAKE